MRNFKQYSILLIYLFFSINLSYANRKPLEPIPDDLIKDSSICKAGRHFVFLIHGIGGRGRTTFSYLKHALDYRLNDGEKDTSKQCNRAIHFDYKTGDDRYTTIDFAKAFSNFLDDVYSKSYSIQDSDKISIVAHSQGGLVGMQWMIQNYSGNPGFINNYIDKMESFTTLSTPFWGASIANIAKSFSAHRYTPFGRKELEEMSYGSDSIFNFYTHFREINDLDIMKPISKNVRLSNVGGYQGAPNILRKLRISAKLFENDTTVPVTSSRMSFINNRSIKENYNENDIVNSKMFKITADFPYYLVKAGHFKAKVVGLKGIAKIPFDCIDNEKCIHPSFNLIINNLLNNNEKPKIKRLKYIESYRGNIIVNLPKWWVEKYPNRKVKVKLKKMSRRVARLGSRRAKRSRVNKDPKQQMFFFSGTIKTKKEYDKNKDLIMPSSVIKATIKAKGLRTRIVYLKVKASYTTFSEINLIGN